MAVIYANHQTEAERMGWSYGGNNGIKLLIPIQLFFCWQWPLNSQQIILYWWYIKYHIIIIFVK